MMPWRRFHRAVFVAAGAYNILWGLKTALDPQWLFRFAGMPPINYPEIFACLGMAIGLYGLLYWEVARVPERGWRLAAVGLAGKVLGPLGHAWLVAKGQWPLSTFVLVLSNDFLWWIPFAIYLVHAWPYYRRQEEELS
jgi:hypothetical protein